MKRLLFILRTLLFGWIVALWTLLVLLIQWFRNQKKERRPSHCVPLRRPEIVTPDPLIYSQYYLSGLGLAVTWDNPDIELWKGGVQVPSAQLEEDTDYEIRARLWNASPEAPAVGLKVHFSYLEFGAGTVSHPIGSKNDVGVGVKGSPSCPSYVSIPWKTPAAAGHYCIQVQLDPVDDLNSLNNLGQENTNVGAAHSPAVFTFALRNDRPHAHQYRFEADAYEIGTPGQCKVGAGGRGALRRGTRERDAREAARELAAGRHGRGRVPLPAGWAVEFSPDSPTLAPDEQINVTATVTPPADFAGTQTVNVNAFDEDRLAGGVTLKVVKA